MVIQRKLKSGWIWEFNDDTKEVSISFSDEDASLPWINIPKTQWFSLFRFLIRACQRLSQKKRK